MRECCAFKFRTDLKTGSTTLLDNPIVLISCLLDPLRVDRLSLIKIREECP
jgi:hypothetical protein